MKPLLLSILAALLLFVPKAAAHTYLDTTNPQDGATVTDSLQTIELKYSGKIEEGSTFTVKASDGTEFALDGITLENGVLTGTLAKPLPNDTYTIEWNSISQDGHPLSGEFAFTVDVPVVEETITETPEEEITVDEKSQVEPTEPVVSDEDEKSSSPLLIVGVILFVIILVSLFTLVKRKKAK